MALKQDLALTELQEQIVRFYHHNPFVEYLHIDVVPELGGGVHLELRVDEYHTNLYGIVHGGVLMTMADTAMGAACLACNKKVVTLELGTDFMHSVPLTTCVRTRAKVLHDGRQTMACECEIINDEGKIFAKSHATFYVLGKFVEEPEEY